MFKVVLQFFNKTNLCKFGIRELEMKPNLNLNYNYGNDQ